MDKSLAIAEMKGRLNALLGDLEETTSSSVRKKIGNLLSGNY